jgi:hypothetical protein
MSDAEAMCKVREYTQDIRTVHHDGHLLTEARARPKAILKISAICSED